MSRNVLAGILLVLASGFATWLLLPLATEPVEIASLPDPDPFVVPIGPFQVNLMLIVLLIAAGTPFAAVVMAVLVNWLSRIVTVEATTSAPAPVRKAAPPAAPDESETAASEQELSLTQKLMWLGIIGVAIAAIIFFALLVVLPPGLRLF